MVDKREHIVLYDRRDRGSLGRGFRRLDRGRWFVILWVRGGDRRGRGGGGFRGNRMLVGMLLRLWSGIGLRRLCTGCEWCMV